LPRIAALNWDAPAPVPPLAAVQMQLLRSLIGFGLWLSRYGWAALGWSGWIVAGGMLLARVLQRWRTRRA
jgi:hypothetical protein